MSKRKRARELWFFCNDGANQEAMLDTPEVHLPYDIPVYKNRVLNRGILTQEQYLDLLSTPKGFRWNKNTGLIEPFKWSLDKLLCNRPREELLENDEPLMITDQRYIRTFLTDIWNYLTPEMLEKLKNILMDDFGMSEAKSIKFLEEQRIRSIFGGRKAYARRIIGKRHKWMKEVSGTLSGRMKDYLVMMLTAERTRRVGSLARTLARKLGQLTGEECSLGQEQQDAFQEREAFMADRLAVWLARLLEDEVDYTTCRDEFMKEEGLVEEVEVKEDEPLTEQPSTEPQKPPPPAKS